MFFCLPEHPDTVGMCTYIQNIPSLVLVDKDHLTTFSVELGVPVFDSNESTSADCKKGMCMFSCVFGLVVLQT